MESVKLAFYKGKGNMIDRIIRWGTASKYSHVELVVDDTDGWSASAREGVVRRKNINFDSGRWDIVEIEWADAAVAEQLITEQAGKKYDYLAVFLNHVLAVSWPGKNRWFCSEIVAYSLEFPKPHLFSPGSLHDMVSYMNVKHFRSLRVLAK